MFKEFDLFGVELERFFVFLDAFFELFDSCFELKIGLLDLERWDKIVRRLGMI